MGKAAQKRVTRRVLLGNPFSATCSSPVSDAVENALVERLTRIVESAGEEGKSQVRAEVVFGLNAVTRAAERGRLSAVLVSKRVQPRILSQQLVSLCAQRDLPLLPLSQLDARVARLFRLSSLMTMGLRKSVESESSPLHTLYKEVCTTSSRATKLPGPGPLSEGARVTVTLPTFSPPPTAAAGPTEAELFLPLNGDPVFPDRDYPGELDTLKMRVLWSTSDLQEVAQSPPEPGPVPTNTPRARYLIEAQTDTVTSFGKVKKKKVNKAKFSS